MSADSRVRTWWRALRHGAVIARELDDELRFHIESYAEDMMRSGVAREEAMRRARVELGSLPVQQESCRRALGTGILDELLADVRFEVRLLAKSPAFVLIAVISLALGIGANTVIFTLTRHLLLDRLAAPHPEQLRLLTWSVKGESVVHSSWGWYNEAPDGRKTSTSFSYPVYEQLRQHNHALEDIFAFKDFGRMTATINGGAEAVTSELVSGSYYSALGVTTALGRPIEEADDKAGGEPVVVISDGFWRRSFLHAPSVVGKTIRLNGKPVTIVGVNRPEFTGVSKTEISPDVFMALSMQPTIAPQGDSSLLTDKYLWWVLMMGRLKPGASGTAASASLNALLHNAVLATMTAKKGENIPEMVLADGSRGENRIGSQYRQPIYLLTALSGFVLLLACANLANLLLARASARQREMSVRLALGAGRARILRQMLTESLLLSLTGGTVGLLLAYGARNVLPRLLSSSWQPAIMHPRFDWSIFAFAAAVSIFTGVLFGIGPAWQSTRAEVNAGLKDAAQTASHRRRGLAGKSIVVVQVALSMILLFGAGIFLRTLINLDRAGLGFRPDHILLFAIEQPHTEYPPPKDIALHHQIEERLAAIPGVDSVGVSVMALISNSMWGYDFTPDQGPKHGKEGSADFLGVNDRFFSTMGIPIAAGRSFLPTDSETSQQVAIVNRKLAEQFFPGENPIGKTFKSGKDHYIQIVGLCGDTKYSDLSSDPPVIFYRPYRQMKNVESGLTYEIHTRMKPQALTPALRAAVQSIDKNLPLLDVRTQQEQIDANTEQARLFATLTSGFGLLALMLACIGIYGLLAYSVARRTHEIGIRLALGAQARQILKMIFRESSLLVVAGIVCGGAAAVACSQLVKSMLYGLKAADPMTAIAAAALLLLVALTATWIPARRASRVDPMRALRHE